MSIIDIGLLAVIGVAAGFAIRHMIRTKNTGGCTGNCMDCSRNCGRKS